jgi:hypothetical protein
MVCVAWCADGVWAQCGDAFDNTLCAWRLSSAQAAQFDESDGRISSFWGDPEAQVGNYISMVAPDNCYPDRCGFTGHR